MDNEYLLTSDWLDSLSVLRKTRSPPSIPTTDSSVRLDDLEVLEIVRRGGIDVGFVVRHGFDVLRRDFAVLPSLATSMSRDLRSSWYWRSRENFPASLQYSLRSMVELGRFEP